jgi:hypothetical protein
VPSSNMAEFCSRPVDFRLSGYSRDSVRMAAGMAVSRVLRDLLTRRESARNLGGHLWVVLP